MNHQYVLDSFETVESLLEQVKEDYIVSDNDESMILKHLEEYFWLKENAEPSTISEKWDEISKILDTFNMRVKQ